MPEYSSGVPGNLAVHFGNIPPGGRPATMTTRQIAELVEKVHGHVMRDTRAMFTALGLSEAGYIQKWIDPQNGQEYDQFALPRDLTLTLVTGYDIAMRKRVVDKLDELQEAIRSGSIAMPDFADPVAAARAWANEFEARRTAERTKAEISSRREATAMNTASQAVKKANALELELDQSKSFATIKRMQMLCHGQTFNWRLLKQTGIEMGIESLDIFDANYGTVKAYHADVWREAYALEIPHGDTA